MSKESYARGFCKAAEAHGVDPTQLAKYAQQGAFGGMNGPTIANAGAQAGFDYASNPLNKADMLDTVAQAGTHVPVASKYIGRQIGLDAARKAMTSPDALRNYLRTANIGAYTGKARELGVPLPKGL